MIANNDSNVMDIYDNIIAIDTIELDELSKEQVVQAYYSNSNGIEFEIECDYELKKVVLKNHRSRFVNETETVYVLSGTTKTSDDNMTENGVTLNGCIGWTDNLGISNEINYVSGSRTGLYSGMGSYSVTGGTVPLGSGDFSISFYNSSISGQATVFRLHVYSKDYYGNQVTLSIATSLLD